MKKSSQSPKESQTNAASKIAGELDLNINPSYRPVEDPSCLLGFINLTRKDSDVLRETKNFPNEYIKILEGRFSRYFKDFFATSSGARNKSFEENLNRGLFKEISFLKNELLVFNKKHKISLSQSIERAKQGDDKSIFRLIRWDKAWVAQDFMQAIIIEKQVKGDSKFFQKLGDALSKLPGCMKAIRQHQRLLEHIKLISLHHDLNPAKTRKQLHVQLDKQGYFDGDKDIISLAEFDAFTKWLKRRKVI
jgi:hypothetical protein